MQFRIVVLAAISAAGLFSQIAQKSSASGAVVSSAVAQSPVAQSPAVVSSSAPAVTAPGLGELVPDPQDSGVLRAQANLDKVKTLVASGALPRVRLSKAEQELQDAQDMSLLRQSLYSKDLTVEQTDQMISVAQRMVFRRNQALADVQDLVASGVMSRSEADNATADLDRARKELDWAIARAKLVSQLAEQMRVQQSIASIELQMEQHPDWVGSVAEKYSGNGIFTSADLLNVETAFMTKFAKPLPISANGETAVHRSLGFDHRGRVDVALNPDQVEGQWLRQYLMKKKIPYFAFRAAVAHRATGAHIHIGPQSTKLAAVPLVQPSLSQSKLGQTGATHSAGRTVAN